MSFCKIIQLYGSPSSREQAKLALENQPQVKRIDVFDDTSQLRLLLFTPLSEGDFISMLQKSGISGFHLSR